MRTALCLLAMLLMFTDAAEAQFQFSWIDADGGDFGDPDNWTGLFEGVPDAFSTATFDLPNSYTVVFTTDHATAFASIRAGDLAFNLLGSTYAVANTIFVGESVGDEATLAASSGTVIAGTTSLGEAIGSTGDLLIGAGATWESETLIVGWLGEGSLAVTFGGQLLSGSETSDTIVAANAGSVGSALVTGDGSIWMIGGPLTIGPSGVLTIADEALVDVGDTMVVEGAVELQQGTLRAIEVTLGDDGLLELADGGRLEVAIVRGDLTNAAGTLTASGRGPIELTAGYTQGLDATLEIVLASASDGEYDALVVTGQAHLDGTLRVNLTDEFVPVPGDEFHIVLAGSIFGVLSDIQLPHVDGMAWELVTSPQQYTLRALIACPADVNGDGFVDTADLLLLFGAWGDSPDSPADIAGADGVVDTADLLAMFGAWGACTE